MSSPSYRFTLTAEQRHTLLLVCDAVLALMLVQLETPILLDSLVQARNALESAKLTKEKIAA